MVVKDRDGRLTATLAALPDRVALPDTGPAAAELCGRFANWLVLAAHVHARGEALRAWDALGHAQRHLTWMVRLAEDRTAHWLTPSRAAEDDLPAAAVSALRAATCAADPGALPAALRAAWREGRARWTALLVRHGGAVPVDFFAELDRLTGVDAEADTMGG